MGGMTDLSDSHTISIGVLDNDSLALNAIAVMTSRLSPRFHIIWSTTSPAMALQRCMTHGARPDVLVVDMAWEASPARTYAPESVGALRRSAWCASPPMTLIHIGKTRSRRAHNA